MTAMITYVPGGAWGDRDPVTLPVGRNYEVHREGACLDICHERAVAIDCPLVAEVLLRTNGDVVL